jgi:hypothetical protein
MEVLKIVSGASLPVADPEPPVRGEVVLAETDDQSGGIALGADLAPDVAQIPHQLTAQDRPGSVAEKMHSSDDCY